MDEGLPNKRGDVRPPDSEVFCSTSGSVWPPGHLHHSDARNWDRDLTRRGSVGKIVCVVEIPSQEATHDEPRIRLALYRSLGDRPGGHLVKESVLRWAAIFVWTALLSGCTNPSAPTALGPAAASERPIEQAATQQIQSASDTAAQAGLSSLSAISADGETYEFGSVIDGTIVAHTFVLANKGNGPLEIARVTTSCGCTTATLARMTLEPGESVKLAAELRTDGLGAPGGKSITRTITVESNDSARPQMFLNLKGVVEPVAPSEKYRIRADDLNALLVVVIDLRKPEEYAAGHLVGAINIPYEEFAHWVDQLPRRIPIIVYDQDGTLGDQLARDLNKADYSEVRSLEGGLAAWMEAFQEKLLFTFKLMSVEQR